MNQKQIIRNLRAQVEEQTRVIKRLDKLIEYRKDETALIQKRLEEAYEEKRGLHRWVDDLIEKLDLKEKEIALIVKGSGIGDQR